MANNIVDPQNPNITWRDNGSGGVNYFWSNNPITREQYQAARPNENVGAIEKWVAGNYAGSQPATDSGPAVVGTYDPAAAQRAADYAGATEDLNFQEGQIDPNTGIARQNLAGQYQAALNKLLGDKSKAERDYKTTTDRTKQGRQDTVARIDQGVSQQYSGIQRLLGAHGAGNSSAAQIAAPYAVGALGNEQRQGVQRAYGMNMQDIATKQGDYLQDWNTKKGETDAWNTNQGRAIESNAAAARLKIAQDRAALNPGNAGAYRQNIHDLLSQIDNLKRVDTYAAPTVAYKAPELTAYGYQPAAGPTQGQTAAQQNVGPYYTLLGEDQKKQEDPLATLTA